MKISFNKNKFNETVKGLVLGILVIIGTFPVNDWSFSVGIDPSLSWLFNYLFENGLAPGKNIIFPHGPLAFLMYPLQENIIIATSIISLLKVALVFNVYRLLDLRENYKWLIAFSFAYLIAMTSGINHIILTNILLLYCNYYNSEKQAYKLLAFFLTAFAFYIKSYVAIVSGFLCLSFLVYYLIKNKNYLKTGVDLVSILFLLLLFWLGMYGTFSGFINYALGMFRLAQDNSSAVSYYPDNNWWILSLFIFVVGLIPFINKTKRSFFYWALITFSLFAAWKHGMAREDNSHVTGFLNYVLIALSIFILFHKLNMFRNLLLSGIALFLLVLNIQNSIVDFSSKYELFGVHNFVEFFTDFSELKSKASLETEKNIISNRLPSFIRDSIGNETVDVYPWDYSIVSANNLNWQPRVVIQSYAAYTSWLDKKNADHFDSEKAPTYIIWEKISNDYNGSEFSSVDNRYLLNDEPQTMVSLINNYNFYDSNNRFIILKKRPVPLNSICTTAKKDSSQWHKWIDVPENSNGLLRAKLHFKRTFLQNLKSFVYKDEQFWIYLKLYNGEVHKYRIVPENAHDGIWIDPYFLKTTSVHPVRQIMFVSSNENILNENIAIDWEKTSFSEEPNCISNFFNYNTTFSDSILYTSLNTFEGLTVKDSGNTRDSQRTETAYLGAHSLILNANSFSPIFSFLLDSLPPTNLKISTDCWVKSPDYNYAKGISLVISIDDKNEHVIYKGEAIDAQLIDKNNWNNIYNYVAYTNNKHDCTLNIFLWNTSEQEALIDDLRVSIINTKTPK